MPTAVIERRDVPARPTQTSRASAVVWIDARRATVARMDPHGHISTRTIVHGGDPEASFLASVVREIGDRERVVIMGPSTERLALEREYVAIYRRPERLVDVEPSDRASEAELIRRLRQLAA